MVNCLLYYHHAIFLPLIGKLSDYYGRKRIFLGGLGLVAISSFGTIITEYDGFARDEIDPAIGTSALFPAGIGIVRSYIKKNKSGHATLAVFATTSAAFGPTISGLLIEYGGWPVIFYVNFPVIILSALLTFKFIPSDQKMTTERYKWDVIGILLFALLMSSWMFFLQSLEKGL